MSTLSKNTSEPRFDYVVCTSTAGLHRMAYREWGDPNNPHVLLCVHGLTRTGEDFDDFARAMSPYYRVVCPDIVGRGHSDHLVDPDGYIVPQYVSDMFTLLARLQPKTLDWVGTSMGGLIGLGVASALSCAKALFAWCEDDAPLNKECIIPLRRMVLNDIGPVINPEGLIRIGNYIDQELAFDTFEEAVESAKVRWQGFGPHSEEQWQRLTKHIFTYDEDEKTWVLGYDLAIAEPFKKQFHQQDPSQTDEVIKSAQEVLWYAFTRLPAEVLIIRGEQSDLLSRETVEAMLACNPKASLYEVAGVGHAPTLMQTDQIERVQQFLLQE